MSHKYDAENAAYEARVRAMVLVDVAPNDRFVVTTDGINYSTHDDPIEACRAAETLAKSFRRKWDVTIQARNAADMS